ncbi:glycoside hydrolase family 19 protein [Endozoicomonas sp. SM1973]|uniref:Glycoside hydrolase family 19 protein n=2 Tax=Spartinivicinus marinus TaxID=2994442 RepID=A0A853I6D6_9GAMM|nr:glycoside hydrolase family 19 protein [Spartinivicinus marinus]
MPQIREQDVRDFLPVLNQEMPLVEIITRLRQAHFISQLAHESSSFRRLEENLNYSKTALERVFGKYFPTPALAEQYQRKPEAIANIVYANRMGNGDEASGDGWRYRGRGLIQLTGKNNYQAASEYCGIDFIREPERIASDPACAVKAACWFWRSRFLNRYADIDDIKIVTKKINGGYHGLKDRMKYLTKAKEAFNYTRS